MLVKRKTPVSLKKEEKRKKFVHSSFGVEKKKGQDVKMVLGGSGKQWCQPWGVTEKKKRGEKARHMKNTTRKGKEKKTIQKNLMVT